MEKTEDTQNCWLHKISHKNSVLYPLLDKGYLSAAFALQNLIKKNDVVVAPNGLYHFSIYKIANNEILLPSELPWESDLENIKSLTGSKVWYDKDKRLIVTETNVKGYDLGVFRKVEILAVNIPEDYADADLISRMNSQDTNANITDLIANVRFAYDLFGAKRTKNYRTMWKNTSSRAKFLHPCVHAQLIIADAYHEGRINWNVYQKALAKIKTNLNGSSMFE
jgi:hypothetical protein